MMMKQKRNHKQKNPKQKKVKLNRIKLQWAARETRAAHAK
jgi:hypothetical protein